MAGNHKHTSLLNCSENNCRKVFVAKALDVV
jgi:hypothetical protein